MKLITNFKDYYDFLQGEFGIDPKAVYERICKDGSGNKIGLYVPVFKRPKPSFFEREWDEEQYDNEQKKHKLYLIAVCGTIYCVVEQGGTLTHGPTSWDDGAGEFTDRMDVFLGSKKTHELIARYPRDIGLDMRVYHLKRTSLNEQYKCPVILLERYHDGDLYANVLNPRLSDFQFAKAMPPKQMFLAITNFLLKDRPIEERKMDPKDRNKQRILAHGFDLKTSFRKDKKA